MKEFVNKLKSHEETLRLDLKTDPKVIEKQALWAGIQPGMRVADLGCGSGKASYFLNKLVQPNAETVGIDFVEHRIGFAKDRYEDPHIQFLCRDICKSLEDLGLFDFIWIRFVLEYHRSNSFEIVKNASKILKPGGILCLIDLDHNCLNHFGLPKRLERTFFELANDSQKNANFDPYAGRKLYSYLYDLEYYDIDVNLGSHRLIFGELKEVDALNWTQKVRIVADSNPWRFDEYEGGFSEFFEEFQQFFTDPRRFTYNIVICCRGRRPKT